MSILLYTLRITTGQDLVMARRGARQIAACLGFGAQDQTRIAVAVSELARKALARSGGQVRLCHHQEESRHALVVEVDGVWVPDQGDVLDEAIIAVHRLADHFEFRRSPQGLSTAVFQKWLPSEVKVPESAALSAMVERLFGVGMTSDIAEMERLNQELLLTLSELRTRQEELISLTRELEDTNRGVVALYAEIEEKSEHLRRADEMKSRFLSNTSHELRTPLGSIRALCNLLLQRVDGDLTDAQEMQVRFIEKAANDLTEMVNDLLDLAKIEAGKVEVTPGEVSVKDLFSTLRGMLRPLSAIPLVDLVFEDSGANSVLYTDEGKISQILRNFISNALKFTERGEVRITAKADPVTGTMKFSVSDTGIGIAPENLELIFEEFSQIENPLQKRSKGTGLGLPLCKKLASLLNGSIEVESKLGAGSRFTLVVPMVYAPHAQSAATDK